MQIDTCTYILFNSSHVTHEKYFLNGDRYNYILYANTKRKNRKTGEVEDAVVCEGYVTDLSHAMDLIYKIETRKYINAHDSELKEAIKFFRQLADEIKDWGDKNAKN